MRGTSLSPCCAGSGNAGSCQTSNDSWRHESVPGPREATRGRRAAAVGVHVGMASRINAYAVVLILESRSASSTSRGRCARPARGDDRRRGPLPRRDGRGQDPLPRLGVGRSNRGPAGRGATLCYLFGHESSSLDAAFMAATGGFSALASHLVKAAPRRRSTPLPSRRATSSSRRPRTSRSRAWSRSPFSARGSRLGPRRCSSSPGRCSCSSCSVGSAGSGVVTTPGASGTASRHRGTVTAARASFPETHLRSGIRIACSPAYREARARPPVRPPGPAHCAAVIPRLRHTCSVAGERFMVMKWIPGAPSARSCCASSVVISTPT